jgi:hypothetical protein
MSYTRAVHVVNIGPCVYLNMVVKDLFFLIAVLLDTNMEKKAPFISEET